ncbi:hypothetical protein K4B79_30625 [Streptomyces lincolnensis]|uniref:hypothetical protein n=1 Tax=Streptomyces lincolnensis TaxID=1915 RepID=UPI001E63F787|nr:hypothetical protein [Streptomyces lincolnensis]MCD7442561.1 hypothetical protein [Streptomyces lincolnensis]
MIEHGCDWLQGPEFFPSGAAKYTVRGAACAWSGMSADAMAAQTPSVARSPVLRFHRPLTERVESDVDVMFDRFL